MQRFSLKMGFAAAPVLVFNTIALLAGCDGGGVCQLTRDPNCDPTKNPPCPVVCVEQAPQQDKAELDDAGNLDGGDKG